MKIARTTALLVMMLGMLLSQEARAFYNPQTGRWPNRDPIGELGRNVAFFNALEKRTLKRNEARLRAFAAISEELREISSQEGGLPPIPTKPVKHSRPRQALQELNLYQFSFNEPISRYDVLGLDSPACDGVPDGLEGTCILECCAQHDKCYHDNHCTSRSWFRCPFRRCGRCNWRAVFCILGCILTGPNDDDPDRQNYYCAVHDVFFDDPNSEHMGHSTDNR